METLKKMFDFNGSIAKCFWLDGISSALVHFQQQRRGKSSFSVCGIKIEIGEIQLRLQQLYSKEIV